MNKVTTVWPLSLRLAHWLNAALVIGALGLGAFMVLAVHSAATRFELTQTHKSIGVSVLVLTILRLCLRYAMRAPKPEPAPRSVAIIAKVAHVGLYILLLLLPLSGWLMVTSTPVRVPTVVFGLFELPYPLVPDMARFRLAHAAHIILAVMLAALVGLHVAAALVHAWVWRDRTLTRMWLRADRAL
jgi:cytochrome b561